jgi:hypothetical protein
MGYVGSMINRQDQAAQVSLDLEAQQDSRSCLTPEQADEVKRIQRGLRDGTAEFATEEQMAAFWKKCGL